MEAAKAVTRGVNIERCVSSDKKALEPKFWSKPLFACGFRLEQPKLKNAALCHDYHGWWK